MREPRSARSTDEAGRQFDDRSVIEALKQAYLEVPHAVDLLGKAFRF